MIYTMLYSLSFPYYNLGSLYFRVALCKNDFSANNNEEAKQKAQKMLPSDAKFIGLYMEVK